MPVIAIPKDIEFRKVTPTQQKSLEKIMSDSKNNTLRAVAIPTIALSTLAIVGGTAFLFREQIKNFIEESKDDLQKPPIVDDDRKDPNRQQAIIRTYKRVSSKGWNHIRRCRSFGSFILAHYRRGSVR